MSPTHHSSTSSSLTITVIIIPETTAAVAEDRVDAGLAQETHVGGQLVRRHPGDATPPPGRARPAHEVPPHVAPRIRHPT